MKVRELVSTRVCAIALLALSNIRAQPVGAERLANVELRPLDENGRTIEGCRVEKFLSSRKEDFSSRFSGLHGSRIPFDTYTYVLRLPRINNQEPEVHHPVAVFRPEKLIIIPINGSDRAGGSLDWAYPQGFVIRGRLVPNPEVKSATEPVWIRLISILGNGRLIPLYRHELQQTDAAVDESGQFRIFDVLVGRYILLVIRGSELLHTQQVQFDDGSSLEDVIVKLPKIGPETLYVHRR